MTDAPQPRAPGPGRPVFLTGMMGSGKTTLAPLLAARWGAPWLDLDTRVERIFGATIAGLFARGEPHFRACEREALRLLLAEPGFSARDVVVATGGGVVVDPVNRAAMKQAGLVVFVDVPVAELTRRLLAGGLGGRPLLAGGAEAAEARLSDLLAQRRAAYEDAHCVVDGSGPPQDGAHRLLTALAPHDRQS